MRNIKMKSTIFIRCLIVWEGNNYLCLQREHSLGFRLDSPHQKSRTKFRRVYPMLRDLTMKTEGNVGRGIILGKAAARVCAVRANSAYTCMYVLGGHGF